MPSDFSEAGFERLPEEWQVQCLDQSALLSAVESAAEDSTSQVDYAPIEGRNSGSAAALYPGFEPPLPPTLPPPLQLFPSHRHVAALIVDELDRALAFLHHERLKLAAGLVAAEELAAKYALSCKRLALDGGSGSTIESSDCSSSGDPYLKARLKGLLVELYIEHAQQVAFRMCNHSAVQRVIAYYAAREEVVEAEAQASRNTSRHSSGEGGGGYNEGYVSVAKGFSLFAMSHALFAEHAVGSDANAALASAAANAADNDSSRVPTNDAVSSLLSTDDTFSGQSTQTATSALSTRAFEVELVKLYAGLFCHGDMEVARTALAYHHATHLGSVVPKATAYHGIGSSGGWGFSSMRGAHRSSSSTSAWARAERAWTAVCLGGWCGGGGLCGALSRGGPLGLGLRLGVACVLLVWVLWDCFVDDDMGKEVWHDPAFKVYRGLGNLILLLVCWGVDLRVWQSYGIDYERFLRMPPAQPGTDPAAQVWNVALDLYIAYLLSLICFWKALRGVFLAGVPPTLAHLFPLSLFLYVSYRAVTPWRDRRAFYESMREVMVAPFGSTAFKEGFVGDVFTSAVRPLSDLTFAALYFLSGAHGWAIAHSSELATDTVSNAWLFKKVAVPAITLSPLWWRFCQCLQRSFDTRERWPHLGNAMKYATAIFVSCYGLAHADAKLHPVWLGAFVFATLYQFTWDVFMDWDLIRVQPAPTTHDDSQDRRKDDISHNCGSFLLGNGWEVRWRSPLLYRNRAFYTVIAIANLGLRFCWALTLIPEGGPEAWQKTLQVRLSPWIAGAEICRRCVWAFLRLENEHLATYGTAVDDSFGQNEGDLGALSLSHLEPMQVLSSSLDGGSSALFFRGLSSSTIDKSDNLVLAELIGLAAFVVVTSSALAFVM